MTGNGEPLQPYCSSPVITYWLENRRTLNIIARKSGFVHGAAAMTAYHSIEPHGGIVWALPKPTR